VVAGGIVSLTAGSPAAGAQTERSQCSASRNEEKDIQCAWYKESYHFLYVELSAIKETIVAVTSSGFEALAGLGARLRRRRLLAGEPQARAASRVDVSVPTYRKLKQGDPAVQIGIWVRAIGLYGP